MRPLPRPFSGRPLYPFQGCERHLRLLSSRPLRLIQGRHRLDNRPCVEPVCGALCALDAVRPLGAGASDDRQAAGPGPLWQHLGFLHPRVSVTLSRQRDLVSSVKLLRTNDKVVFRSMSLHRSFAWYEAETTNAQVPKRSLDDISLNRS